jgi:hypothetical protein
VTYKHFPLGDFSLTPKVIASYPPAARSWRKSRSSNVKMNEWQGPGARPWDTCDLRYQ